MVVGIAEVSEYEYLRRAVIIVSKKLCRGPVRKVTLAAHDALLHEPGIGPHLQHLEIVVGFKNQAMAASNVLFDDLGYVAQVRHHSSLDTFGFERKRHRVRSVVRN